MALEVKDEISKLKEENENLKKQSTPLSESERKRYNELHETLVAMSSSDGKFKPLTKEYDELKSRSRITAPEKYKNIGKNIRIGG
jgi:uncharacterized protein YdcH (DUF465 family)